MEAQTPKKMGRPGDTLGKHPRTLNFPDDLWEAIGAVRGDSEYTKFIMEHLRAIPEVAAYLERKKKQ